MLRRQEVSPMVAAPRFWWTCAVGSLLICSVAGAAPVTVSPGDRAHATTVATACPTFSWAPAAGAAGYELVVYGVEGKVIAHEPLLRKRIAGAATWWTPGVD